MSYSVLPTPHPRTTQLSQAMAAALNPPPRLIPPLSQVIPKLKLLLSERVRGLSFANDACVGGYWSWSFALGTPFLVVAPVHKPDAAATPLPTFGGVHFESESSRPAESEQVKPTSGAARKVHRTHEARVVRHLLSAVRHG